MASGLGWALAHRWKSKGIAPMTQDKPHSGDTTTVERVRDALGEPEEWANKLAELYTWSGSKVASETPGLHVFLCSLIGYLSVGQDAAALATDNADEPSEAMISAGSEAAMANAGKGKQRYYGAIYSAMQAARGQS